MPTGSPRAETRLQAHSAHRRGRQDCVRAALLSGAITPSFRQVWPIALRWQRCCEMLCAGTRFTLSIRSACAITRWTLVPGTGGRWRRHQVGGSGYGLIMKPEWKASEYSYRIRWSAAECGYVASVAEFPGLTSGPQTTPHAAFDALTASVVAKLRELDGDGEPRPAALAHAG